MTLNQYRLWLNVNKNEKNERNLRISVEYYADTQIGLLGGKYPLALAENSAFANLMLYLTTVNSHDFSLHFDTSF